MADLPTHTSVDLLIVGAGPGGTAAAIEARSAGLDVLVVDKARFPRDKCCGDGLTTGALRRLDALGLDPEAVPSWQVVEEVHVRTPGGRNTVFPLPDDGVFAAVARRSELDAALVDRARAAGAEVVEACPLVEIEIDGNPTHPVTATVEPDGAAGPSTVRARFAIAADGMWSPTRKFLGLDDGRYRGEWHAFRQYFTNVTGRAATDLLVWFEPDLLPGYAWSFPLAGGAANVGFGILRQPGESVQPMKQLWPELLARPHVVEALGRGAEPEAAHRAWPIPARLGRLPVAHGPVLFIGDALAAADPMTGEGIGQALETGQAAVEAIVANTGDSAAAGAHYRHELDRTMVRDHALARALGRILASRRGADGAVRIAGATDWTRRNFARWLFEDYPRAALATPNRWHRRLFTSPGAYRSNAPTSPAVPARSDGGAGSLDREPGVGEPVEPVQGLEERQPDQQLDDLLGVEVGGDGGDDDLGDVGRAGGAGPGQEDGGPLDQVKAGR
ncbi:MAG: geranylgeranyl reductase family protein [Actinomycetota bacterium]